MTVTCGSSRSMTQSGFQKFGCSVAMRKRNLHITYVTKMLLRRQTCGYLHFVSLRSECRLDFESLVRKLKSGVNVLQMYFIKTPSMARFVVLFDCLHFLCARGVKGNFSKTYVSISFGNTIIQWWHVKIEGPLLFVWQWA